MITIYRLAVFASGTRTVGKGKRQRTVPYEYGYIGWTPDQYAETGRLPGSGSFCYYGALRAIVAARQYLRRPETHQVQIRTNQDRKVVIYNKHADGRVTQYAARED